MKKILITAVVVAVLVACNSGDKSKSADTNTSTTPTETSTPSDNPDYKAGLALVSKSDCFTCHKVDEAATGPAYRDIANKYASEAPGVIPQLAEKIIKGGTGVWGSAIMLPHPNISQADAETMVKYVLLLKK
jgi:cytochrome c